MEEKVKDICIDPIEQINALTTTHNKCGAVLQGIADGALIELKPVMFPFAEHERLW